MEITKQQAIADLTKIFNTRSWEDREDGKSFADKGDFFIDKRDCERCEAMAKVKEYFKDEALERLKEDITIQKVLDLLVSNAKFE